MPSLAMLLESENKEMRNAPCRTVSGDTVDSRDFYKPGMTKSNSRRGGKKPPKKKGTLDTFVEEMNASFVSEGDPAEFEPCAQTIVTVDSRNLIQAERKKEKRGGRRPCRKVEE